MNTITTVPSITLFYTTEFFFFKLAVFWPWIYINVTYLYVLVIRIRLAVFGYDSAVNIPFTPATQRAICIALYLY